MKTMLKLLLKVLIGILVIPFLLILGIVVPIEINNYYSSRIIVPIEWAGESDKLCGTKIKADFIDMRSSSRQYPVTKKFVIGKTEKLVLPHSLFLFDGESVRPENINLKLSDGEFIDVQHWNEETQKWESTGKKMIFYVEKTQK